MLKYKHKRGNDVASQTKLDNLRIVKHEFGAEEYVKFVMNKKTTIDSSSATSRMPSYRNRAYVKKYYYYFICEW